MRAFLTLTVIPALTVGLTAALPHQLIAASPSGLGVPGLSLTVPSGPMMSTLAPPPAPAPPASAYQPAPLPNRDVDTPLGPKTNNAPSVGPGLFTRSDTYRGEGFNQGSTAQSEQEKRSRPAAGLSLTMPFTGN